MILTSARAPLLLALNVIVYCTIAIYQLKGSMTLAISAARNETIVWISRTSDFVENMTLLYRPEIYRTSRTKPKFYPFGGTGRTVNIDGEYDSFNSFCKTGGPLDAIVPIYSSPGNVARRTAIRATLGRECVTFKCRIFFIVGVSANGTLNEAVKKEYKEQRDMLVINKMDTYRDLNNKAVAMLDWLIEHCPEPSFVIHLIDDTYPNFGYFLKELNSINKERFILGHFVSNAVPIRDPNHVWYVSEDEYPYKVFPKYALGTAYAFLNRDCQHLRRSVHHVEYNWIEDVWFTGILAAGAGFELLHVKLKHTHGIPIPIPIPKGYTGDKKKLLKYYSIIHQVGVEGYYTLFDILNS